MKGQNLTISYKNQNLGKKLQTPIIPILIAVEKMYQWALQGKEKTWGPDHISVLDTINNLGILYKYQGKLDEAEKMYQRAVQGEGMGFPQLGQPLLYSGQARRCRDVPVGIARIC
jgi:tetratricopeptide repeat protein